MVESKGIVRTNVYSVIEKLYLFFVLMYFLSSMHPWFLGEIELHQINALYTILFVLCIVCLNKKVRLNSGNVFFCVCLWISSCWGMDGALLGPTFLVLPFFLIVFTSDVLFYNRFLKLAVSFFALFLPFSYLFFLFAQFGLPPISFFKHSVYPIYANYVFCIANSFYGVRFSSIFLEPGHLAIVLCVLIFANGYNFKDKKILILSVFVFLTFSLAGFLLFAVGFFLTLYMQGKLNVKKIIPFVILFLCIALIAFKYKEGDNFLYEHFFSRLEFDEDKGISGNNRVSEDVSLLFEKIVSTSLFWTGFGMEEYSLLFKAGEDGSGILIFILQKGFVSVLLVFFSYLTLGMSLKKNTKVVLSVLLFYFIMYFQRFYPYWSSFLLTYVCTMTMIDKGVFLDKVKILLCKQKLYIR